MKFDVRTLLASVNKNNTFLKARTTKQLRGSAAGQFRANRVDTLKSEIQPLEFVGFQETIVRKHQLLNAGVPAWQVADQARKHLVALQQLPVDAEGRDEAIAATEQFIAELPPGLPH